MRIIKDRAIVEDDCAHLEDGATLPGSGPVTVSLARWKTEREALIERGDVGVRIASDEDPRELSDDLGNLPRIALEFPRFADGRGYSHAHVLRAQLAYPGELRAIGDVLRDQIWNMARVGINAFELAEGKSLDDAMGAFDLYSVKYQSTVDQPLPIYRQSIP